ncbi:hypothetical protein [unidentified bacterial endosymbiont]|uniref:hypothetical protein n=1 Tax=unidentified bacterial endosymbiont TaxID=2355 RepID=UPI00209F4988|nr:hypothetical protein [unidentified bacterial endosymbiont]
MLAKTGKPLGVKKDLQKNHSVMHIDLRQDGSAFVAQAEYWQFNAGTHSGAGGVVFCLPAGEKETVMQRAVAYTTEPIRVSGYGITYLDGSAFPANP